MKYPKTIDGDALLALVSVWHRAGCHEERYTGGTDISDFKWKLTELPIAWLHAGGEFDEAVALSYAEKTPTMPPIVVNKELFVLDGFHRFHGCRLSGKTIIKAYIPLE